MSKERIGQAGCLLSTIAPAIALVIYPAAKWLFFVPVVLMATLLIASQLQKDLTPSEVADLAAQLLDGDGDVDGYVHLNPRNPAVRELWAQTMSIGGLPEEWPTRDESTKNELRKIISTLRKLEEKHIDA